MKITHPKVSTVADGSRSVLRPSDWFDEHDITGFYDVPYGSMYADDASIAITIGSGGAYVQVGAGISDGGSSADFTFQNARELKCNTAGTYLASYSISMSSATNNEQVSGTIMVNGAHISTTEGSAQSINSGKPVCVAGAGVLSLKNDDLVSLAVENEDAAHNITITHLNLALMRVA